MKEFSIQLWSYHLPCAAHLAETGQEHTTGRLVGASVGSAQPQGPSVGMDPSGGNSSRSYRLGNTSVLIASLVFLSPSDRLLSENSACSTGIEKSE